MIGTVAGPHITRYELRLAPGTKVAKVAQLKDDLAYALAATDIRILAPIPGKQAVGVEVPNAHRRIVRLGDVFQQPPKDWSPLTVWLGKDVAGKAIGADLAKMPHLLVAGTTGAGKSGAINAMLCSVLLRATPHELRLVLVDPKQVELNHYESIPHLLTPVITSPRMAANALQNLVKEMEQRYGIMSLARTRSLVELNRARAKREEPPLPYILCVIDELADLMMVAPADVEDSIIRLAQKARAVGIHLVLATQSPRVDVITGMIKANVPSRIAFAVSSRDLDSRVILDQNGAESLLGQGDMLFSPVAHLAPAAHPGRLHRRGPDRQADRPVAPPGRARTARGAARGGRARGPRRLARGVDPDEDPLLSDAIRLVAEMQTAMPTSMLQRRLRLGYTRAGRMIDMLERRGVISGYEGSKPRQVLITEADLPRVLAGLEASPARPAAASPAKRPAFPGMPEIEQRSTRRACALASTCRDRGPDQDPGRSICARWRTKSGAKLPGPTFVKSLLRTYAQALGLDGKMLVEEYRLHHERPERRGASSRSSPRRKRPHPPRAVRPLTRLHDRDRRGGGDRGAADRAARRGGGRNGPTASTPAAGQSAATHPGRRPGARRRARPPHCRHAYRRAVAEGACVRLRMPAGRRGRSWFRHRAAARRKAPPRFTPGTTT